MKSVSLKNPVMRSWLRDAGFRLDAPPFLSRSVEIQKLLLKAKLPKEPLESLTAGHAGGIFNGPIFSRVYVDDPTFGVRFLSSSDMLRADLSGLLFLRKSDAESSKLAYLRLEEGSTLISCSGTIGKMAYTRSDMTDIWSSQHIMKVVPDTDRILSGYLYAFLSSEFGNALITGETYGSVIQSIEPRHISRLPVPRLGEKLENSVHSLICEASRKLSSYQHLINAATAKVSQLSGLSNPSRRQWHEDRSDLGFSVHSRGLKSLRAWNLSRRVQHLRDQITAGAWSPIGEVVDEEWLKWRVMFKRIDVEPEHGIEVITQRPLFHLFPEGRWLSRAYLLDLSSRYVVPDQTILVAKQGTLGEDELYCQCEFITGARALNRAYSDHCMRLVVKKKAIDPGYLFAFLRSEAGFRLLRALSEGAKQQDIHWRTIPHLPIPRLTARDELTIGNMTREAYTHKNEAIELILKARNVVETQIEVHG
jgi:hypothetical protein